MTTVTNLTSTQDLLMQLADVNCREFHRPAIATVYREYELFMETQAFPYISSVVGFIVDKYGLPEEMRKDCGTPLSHEVYLASGQYKVRQMEELEQEFAARGLRPITDLVPVEGMKIRLGGVQTYRLKAHPTRRDWTLLPPRKQTNGISLRGLLRQHMAYEVATLERQTRMNSPRVWMFEPVEGPSA